MGRLNGMTQTNLNGTSTSVSGVTYNAAGQMTQLNSTIIPEARQYNSLGQLTNITSGNFNLSYNYTSGQNNGKIASQTDNWSGETVTYAYDALNRLISAQGSVSFGQSGTNWGQGFQYDPFGNLSAKTVLAGSAPTWSAAPDVTTNRVGGTDANGNSSAYGWDAENRLVASANPPAASYTRYAYDGLNKQIWSCTWNTASNLCTTDNGYLFYSPGGKLLGTFTIGFQPYYYVKGSDGYQLIPDSLTINNGAPLAYLGSRLLTTQDRAGSQGRFFPYGEDRTGMNYSQTGQVAFATYLDNGSGVYYADQRWYAAAPGRFLSPDPYSSSAGPADPPSWNRYSYTSNDPINFVDPHGLYESSADGGLPPDFGVGTTLSSICLAQVQSEYQAYLAEMGLMEAPSPFGGSGYGAAQNACMQLVGYAPAPPPPPPPDCQDGLPRSEITFVENNYTAANSLGNLADIPGLWILGWASFESGWGLNTAARFNNNYFSWRGRGNTPCPRKAQRGFGCFTEPGFFNSGAVALFSTNNYFQYNQQIGVAAATILSDQYDSGASAAQAFGVLAQAGYDRADGATYGGRVATRIGEVLRVEICLQLDGIL
jgi:RHS repeat-associated protein